MNFDRNLDRFEAKANSTSDAISKDVERINASVGKKLDSMQERMSKETALLRRELERQENYQRETSAHQTATLAKMLKNLADNATDLKHAEVMNRGASELAARARAISQSEPKEPPQQEVSEIDAVVGQTTRRSQSGQTNQWYKPDAQGMKMSYHKPNQYDEFHDDYKAWLRSKFGVRSKQEFDGQVAHMVCSLCPEDAPNMPHLFRVCPLAWQTRPDYERTHGAVKAARAQAKVKELLSRDGAKNGSLAALVSSAQELDAAGHDLNISVVEECMMAIAMTYGDDVDLESLDAETFMADCERVRCADCDWLRRA